MKKILFSAAALCLLLVAACGPKTATKGAHLVPKENFDEKIDTIPVQLYTITNGTILAQVTNYGARMVSLYTADRNGKADNILVGRSSLKDYQVARGERLLGAVSGPLHGTVGGGSFTMDGVSYNIDPSYGLDKLPWTVQSYADSLIRMQLIIPDGAGGLPGKRIFQVTYALSGNGLMVLLRGFGNVKTPISLAWQPWFNLHGEGEGTIEDHELSIAGITYLPLDENGVPTGEFAPTADTPYDFISGPVVGDRLNQQKGGFNNTWCLAFEQRLPIHLACELTDPVSGRKLTVFTNRSALQMATGDQFDGSIVGSNGKPIDKHGAILLAPTDLPDAVNHSNFPSVIVEEDGFFASTLLYRFETIE